MAQMMTVKEAAMCWSVAESQVTRYCRDGRIEGAYKSGRAWLIPADTAKPIDLRKNSGDVQKLDNSIKLPLPIGVSDYRLASSEYYYVDKTMLIKDFLDERPMVSLFTRPRRFGKTLNMDMIRTFFEKTEQDTSVFFKDKKIWACGKKYQDYQGKYPVIFVTFKDVKYNSWEETFEKIAETLSNEFSRHPEVYTSQLCNNIDKAYFQKAIEMQTKPSELTSAFSVLSRMLHQHHGIAPIIIIDEYDTPIQQGHMCGFYDEGINFVRNLFSGGLKDNKHLSYGFLTGILRVTKESIFSGLNNLKINSILDNKYSQYFGFTAEEVREMAEYYQAAEKYDEICTWYDGYRFGKTDIFNPWSVINYFNNECEPRAFWLSTGSNEIIGEILEEANEDIFRRLNALMQGESFTALIDTSVIYPQINKNPSSIYSFLLVAGYLKVLRYETSFSGDFMCEVALPNREIISVYNKEILTKLHDIVPQSIAVAIQEAIYSNRADELKGLLERLLLESASCHDTVGENFYHGLVLGLCAMMDNRYYVTSNRESGEGRYDIQLMPKSTSLPGILIELKAGKKCSEQGLKALSEAALWQIHDRKYDVDMTTKGIKTVFKYGVAFSGKRVEITTE